ncbi:MAG: alanine dehydrogenase [Chitinophagales bacterium]
MEKKQAAYGSFEFALTPQEEMLEMLPKKGKLFLGVPKETSFQESRVALTPSGVALLVNNGHKVVVESQAGEKADFTDQEYAEAGAEIAFDTKRVFEAHIILKIAPPRQDEIELLQHDQIIFSPLHLPTITQEYLKNLQQKKVTALAYEYIKDESGAFPMVRTLSEIAGYTSILIAAEYLNNNKMGKGILLGGVSGVPPAKVLILGAGVVGEFATRAALGLGAEVRVFDNNIYKLLRLQNNVNVRVFTSIIDPNILTEELKNADVVIGAIHSESGRSPVVVTDAMISNMKAGSVIVDVSIDQGGCFETSRVTSHENPIFIRHDVIHYCVPNIASRVAKTASSAMSHALVPLLLKAQEFGGFEKLLYNSMGTRHGVYVYKGILTNQHLGQRFGITATNINLLMASSS